jgi:hypothetical protein
MFFACHLEKKMESNLPLRWKGVQRTKPKEVE